MKSLERYRLVKWEQIIYVRLSAIIIFKGAVSRLEFSSTEDKAHTGM